MASAKPLHPKRFEAAVAESQHAHQAKRFLANRPKLALLQKQAPWDMGDSEAGWKFGEHPEDQDITDYSVGHFIGTDDDGEDTDDASVEETNERRTMAMLKTILKV